MDIVSLAPYRVIYRVSYDRMSQLQPPRLGDYQLTVSLNSVIMETRTLMLRQGYLSPNQTRCSFSSCDTVGSICIVLCLLRDANGNILRENDEKLVLELTISDIHSTLNTDFLSVNETFINYGNGSCVLTFRLQYAGFMTLRIRDLRSQHYLADSWVQELKPLAIDISQSSVSTPIPTEWQVQNPLHIEVILMDSYSNRICEPDKQIQVVTLIHMESLSSVRFFLFSHT